MVLRPEGVHHATKELMAGNDIRKPPGAQAANSSFTGNQTKLRKALPSIARIAEDYIGIECNIHDRIDKAAVSKIDQLFRLVVFAEHSGLNTRHQLFPT